MRRTRRTRNPLISGINVTMFSAVMVVMALSGFVIESAATPPFDSDSNHAKLPQARHSVMLRQALRDDAMKISITRDGKVFYGNDRLDPRDLRFRILQDLSQGSEKKVYLQVDKRAKYAAVKDVLCSIQAAGIEKIAFYAQPPLSSLAL